jgi:ubiquinone/menaquinone biosynthesis C-methylase UbiE
MRSTLAAHIHRPPRTPAERTARIYDEEIHPVMDQRLDALLRTTVAVGLRSDAPSREAARGVLHLGASTGSLTADLLRIYDHETRVVAVDARPALLELARERIGREHPGRRVSFQASQRGEPLPFTAGQFDVAIAQVSLEDWERPATALGEVLRVVAPGGLLAFASPVAGTWQEPLDVLREVMQRRKGAVDVNALERQQERLCHGGALVRVAEGLGAVDVTLALERWELLFRSGREFLQSPVIEAGPLRRWRSAVGEGTTADAVFADMARAIDRYFYGRAFAVSVVAACLSGRKAAAKAATGPENPEPRGAAKTPARHKERPRRVPP